jgi:hypothetical protein
MVHIIVVLYIIGLIWRSCGWIVLTKLSKTAILVVVHPPNLGMIKEGFGIMSQPNLWLIKEGFGRAGQPVNTTRGNQQKTNL